MYQPNNIKGNKPVTLGHQYSTVALLPERNSAAQAAWVVPLATRRVRTDADKELAGAEQIDALLANEQLPFRGHLCVEVGDTSYSKPAYLHAHRKHPDLVTLARVRSNRNFYRQPERPARGAGHPRWFGDLFALQDPQSWHAPDEQLITTHVSQRGKEYRVEVLAWHDMLMRGKRKPAPLPMHRYPFTLVRIVLYDQNGRPAFKQPLWLIVVGERRRELSLLDIYQAYRQRAGLEHFFRFGKQKLLADKIQTPHAEREEAWWQLVLYAYAQLWLARGVAQALPRPWERHLPRCKSRQLSPALVQRDFGRIIRQLGTPARAPKLRGYSPGRARGTRLPPRPRRAVIIKSQMAQQPP